jgi:CheY-like chemotaxis protein
MKTILVADDKESEVSYLIDELTKQYSVEYVSHGKDAIERIEKGGIDAAILDWFMPPPNMAPKEAQNYFGNRVAMKAREIQPSIVLILRTSDSLERFKEQLQPYNVFCHKKYDEKDKPILDYLIQELK